MFLSVPCPALPRLVEADTHDIEPGAGQNRRQAVLRPVDLEGVLQGLGQPGEDLRQTVGQGLGEEQSRPDNGEIEEQPDEQVAGLGWLFQ